MAPIWKAGFILGAGGRHAAGDPAPHVEIHENLRQLASCAMQLRLLKDRIIRAAQAAHAASVAEAERKHEEEELERRASMGDEAEVVTRHRSSSFAAMIHRLRGEDKSEGTAASWEDANPALKDVVDDLTDASLLIETRMVIDYRLINPDIKDLLFLFEAYEPRCYYFEAIECFRRLALTGLLVFIEAGSLLQIVCASFIAMIAMIVYGVFSPFDKQSDDNLFVFAQLMTFLQLYFALIIRTDAMEGAMSENMMGGFMLFFNFAVMIFSAIGEIAEEVGSLDSIGEVLEEAGPMIGMIFAGLCAIFGCNKCKKKKDHEDTEEEIHSAHEHVLHDASRHNIIRKKSIEEIETHIFTLKAHPRVDLFHGQA
jgi:hypothetical protein